MEQDPGRPEQNTTRRFEPPGPAADPGEGADQAAGSRMAEEDRHGFVAAFVNGVRPDAGRGGRPGRRTLLWGTAAAVAVAAGALAVGALAPGRSGTSAAAAARPSRSPSPSPDATTSPAQITLPPSAGPRGAGTPVVRAAESPTPSAQSSAAAPAAAAQSYSAVAGLNCSGSSTATYSDTEGYFTEGDKGWLRTSTGGYSGSGCTGEYEAIPMSGTAGVANYNKTDFALYWWNFSAQFTTASCHFSLYVPDNTDETYVGGDPTYYYFWARNYQFGVSMEPTGDFGVDEVGELGNWVDESPFPVTTGQVTLKIVDAGVDYGSAGDPDYHHHAAAPVRSTCTASS